MHIWLRESSAFKTTKELSRQEYTLFRDTTVISTHLLCFEVNCLGQHATLLM